MLKLTVFFTPSVHFIRPSLSNCLLFSYTLQSTLVSPPFPLLIYFFIFPPPFLNGLPSATFDLSVTYKWKHFSRTKKEANNTFN